MIKMNFEIEFIKRFKNFLISDVFEQPEDAKSGYWEDYTKKINVIIKDSTLLIQGKAGNYIPSKKYTLQFFMNRTKSFMEKIINKNSFMSYEKAFNKVMGEKEIPAYQQIEFDYDKIIAKNILECKKIFPFKYNLNKHYIRSYYYLNVLSSYIDLSKSKFIVEIGAGNGNLLSILKYHFSPKCIINIDLPETLTISIPFLKDLFPEAKILFPNEINEKINLENLQKYDFIFLTPNQISKLDESLFDLFINTTSLQEMNMSQIQKYINLIQKIGKNGSFFFNANRVEKAPHDGPKTEEYRNIKPTRFAEYPFFENNKVLFLEICRFTSLIQNHPLYTKLEKIVK
tara:strand:- start:30 stop:1058 length:1029 start_codon:yes stop_codon:yes gene_type:complete